MVNWPHDHTCGLVLLVPGIVSGTKVEHTCTMCTVVLWFHRSTSRGRRGQNQHHTRSFRTRNLLNSDTQKFWIHRKYTQLGRVVKPMSLCACVWEKKCNAKTVLVLFFLKCVNLQQNKEKTRTEGKKCHVKTMMSRKADKTLKQTPNKCRLGRTWSQEDEGRG